MARGYVYILFNPSLRANRFKIGLTTGTPEERARELSRATGVPQPFEVAFSLLVEDCSAAERLVHQRLSSFRVGKEFFELPLASAIDTVQSVADTVGRATVEVVAAPAPADALPSADAAQLSAAEVEVGFGTPEASTRRRLPGGSPAAVSFEDHLRKLDLPRQQVLLDLRTRVLELGGDVRETITPANRIAFRRGRVFLEVKILKDRLRILFLDADLPDDRKAVSRVPETHGWGRLRNLMNIRSSDDLNYAMPFVTGSYSVGL